MNSFPPKRKSAISSLLRRISRRVTRNSLETKSRRPILKSYQDYGQNLFDRYIDYADAWIEDQDFKDPDTGQLLDRELLNQELTKIEKPAGIANPKDFRNEIVKFALRWRAPIRAATRPGRATRRYAKSSRKRMFSQVEDLLPVISFATKKDTETENKHGEFVSRMVVARLYRTSGAASRGVVHARQACQLIGARRRVRKPAATIW